MNKIKFYFGLITLISFLGITIFSCGKGDKRNVSTDIIDKLTPADTAGAVTGDWLIKREMSDAEKLNPIVTNDNTAEGIFLYIFEALNDFEYDKLELIPWIGSLPEISEDHLTYTYKLRTDVKFSDGKPLTGEDIIFTMKFLKNPFADDAALRNYYEPVKKVELVNNDPYTIRIIMSEPYWRAIYSNGAFPICPKHILDPEGLTDKYTWEELKDFKAAEKNPAIKKFADFVNSQEVSREPRYVVGSGPYTLEKWETGQSITLKRNPDWWGLKLQPTYVNKIVYRIIQDNSAAAVATKNKEVDLMYVVKPDDFYKTFEKSEEFGLLRATPSEPRYSYIGWNLNNPLFSDKKVRLALSHLVDRKTLIDKIYFGQSVPIQSHINYNDKKHLNTELPEIPFDPQKAKQLLEQAGWKDNDGNGVLEKFIDGKETDFKFTFLINTNPVRKQILLVVIDALKKVGIQADLQELEWSVYLDKVKKHEFDATLGGWVAPVTPPDPFQIWHSSQTKGEGSNIISFINAESDKILEEYRSEFDENKRIDLIKRWQKIIYDEQPYTFLWGEKAKYVFDSRYHNTRWYPKRNSMEMDEWWVPKSSQKYTQSVN
ncbi:MAG: ABC transporter substrate-binding protein [Ignavibacteria bacterium]